MIRNHSKKKWLLGLPLLLMLFLMLSVLPGCSTEEAAGPVDNGEYVDDVQDTETPVELDEGEVIRTAVEGFFDHIAEGNSNIMSSQDVYEQLEANPNALFVLDIRSMEDYEAGHIDGAVNSPWGEVAEIMDRLPRNKPVAVVCYTGQTAGQTVGVLRTAGFDNVYSIASGMNLGWKVAELPMEDTEVISAKDLEAASSPRNEGEEILWDAVRDYFDFIKEGNNNIITPEDLHEQLQENPNSFYILDIRRAGGQEHDYDTYHIENSVNISWGEVGQKLDELPTNRPIAVGCYSGQTAGQTVGVLRMAGFNAVSIRFGVREGWVINADLPVVN